jgi:hypothetical protein
MVRRVRATEIVFSEGDRRDCQHISIRVHDPEGLECPMSPNRVLMRPSSAAQPAVESPISNALVRETDRESFRLV